MNPRTPGYRLLLIVALLLIAAVNAWTAPGPPVAESWPMLGGSPSRHMANPAARNVPTEWSVEEGKPRNVKWAAKLGTVAYGCPAIVGGRVFIGTNNGNPRNEKIQTDKGIMMCFEEATG